jgi:hypothetical protein
LSSGEMVACATDAVLCSGVALTPADGAVAYQEGGVREIDTGKVLVAVAGPGHTFLMKETSGDAPAITDVGVAYGIVLESNGTYTIDSAETTATLVTVVDIDLDRNLWEVEVIAAKAELSP